MTYYPDLSTECYFESGPEVRAIGWLSADHAFSQGAVSPEFFARLEEHVTTAWFPVATMGWHACEFCSLPTARGLKFSRYARLGSGNLWIPTASVVYVAPAMILHYIAEHGYAPPEEFIAAVLDCPPQGSREYLTLLHGLPTWWTQMHLGTKSVEDALEAVRPNLRSKPAKAALLLVSSSILLAIQLGNIALWSGAFDQGHSQEERVAIYLQNLPVGLGQLGTSHLTWLYILCGALSLGAALLSARLFRGVLRAASWGLMGINALLVCWYLFSLM